MSKAKPTIRIEQVRSKIGSTFKQKEALRGLGPLAETSTRFVIWSESSRMSHETA
jgi:hypothetical protein